MTRSTTITLAAVIAAIIAVAMLGGVATPAAAAASCNDSWAIDSQHLSPWYTGSNQTLHGNTLLISCPGASTPWKVVYKVQKSACGSGCDLFFPIDVTRSGNGDAQFSVNTGPIGCNVGWEYLTHVHNSVTGGDIYRPNATGFVIC